MSVRRRAVSSARPNGPIRLSHPYRGTFAPPYNATNRLTIPTPVPGINAMHPDVLDMGTAWHGYRYWMAFTPYNGTADTEIPCIVATNDITSGGTWVVPTGYTNPITPDPAGAAHMADTDLVYDAATDRLYVFYITTDGSTYQDIRSKWTDGTGSWSTETVVLSGTGGTYANPSAINTATGWRLYYNIDSANSLRFRDTASTPDTGYGTETTTAVSLDFGFGSRRFQNLNMVRDNDGTLVAVISDANASTVEGTLLFARSTDGGTTFTITGPPVLEKGPVGAWDGGGIYRASLLVDTSSKIVADTDGKLHLWYSAYVPAATTWGTGYTKIPAACLRL